MRERSPAPGIPILALGCLAALAAGLAAGPAAGQEKTVVDLELVLAVDVSQSMDLEEQTLQREGYVAAFRHDEVIEALGALRDAGVDVVTIGQYLRPTAKHAPVVRYVTPDAFDAYRDAGLALGLKYVASGPLVRSSYRAAEAFMHEAVRANGSLHDIGAQPRHDRYGNKRRLEVV